MSKPSVQIVGFTAEHIEDASRIAQLCYKEERGHTPALPFTLPVPDMADLVANGLGVAAFADGEMVGYLAAYAPFAGAFRSTDAVGVFSPMHGNGVIGHNRADTYAQMYQAAAETWVRAGATSHAVCLYAHDVEAQQQFYRYGFGMRCVDAIRPMQDIAAPPLVGATIVEVKGGDALCVLPLQHALEEHMANSPFFMLHPSEEETAFLARVSSPETQVFAAMADGQPLATLTVEPEGETCVSGTQGYRHISQVYCLPAHRGKGLLTHLLRHVMATLQAQGHLYLGVDYESINPAAAAYWGKHFTPYTHGLVRRIDEHILRRMK